MYLNFTADDDNLTAIEAGKPYIVKWSATTPDYIENPVFTGVTLSTALTEVKGTDGTVSFVGTFSPRTYAETDRSILFLGAGNTLYYPQPADAQHPVTIGSCRAYFYLDGITAGDPALSRFVLSYGGEESTGVTTPLSLQRGAMGEAWFTLEGHRLSGKPTAKGVYVNNGKKLFIK